MWFIKDTFKKLIVDLNKKKSSDFFTMVAHIISALFSILCLLAGLILTPLILFLYLSTYQIYALIYLIAIVLLNFILLKYNYKNTTNNYKSISKIRDITSYIILFCFLIHNCFFTNSIIGGYQTLFFTSNLLLNYIIIYLFITISFYIAIYFAFYITFLNIIILRIKPKV